MPQTIIWEEPNRAKTLPLHIASSGERYSTLTGVCWLDESRFVVNHRNGLRIALFDLNQGTRPIVVAKIPHLTDDVCAKRLDKNLWEISVSGCWACAFSSFELTIGPRPRFRFLGSSKKFNLIHRLIKNYSFSHKNQSFSHGVEYDRKGQLWFTYSTGTKRSVEIHGLRSWAFPRPWGPKNICFDEHGVSYAIAHSSPPKRHAYREAGLSVWRLNSEEKDWQLIAEFSSVHPDTCAIFKEKLWVNDQLGDKVLGIDLQKGTLLETIEHEDYDFPHGLGISPSGLMAVTNYGSQTITLKQL